MTESDLVAALRPIAEALGALGVRYYLVGSVASSAHGVARASLDVDIVAFVAPHHVDALVSRLENAYYVPIDRLKSAAASGSSCNLIHLATMFKIDIFVPTGRDFDRAAVDRARLMTIGDAGMLELPVASPEDTVLAKLDWYRRGGETSERQWWDLVGILKVTRDADREYLSRWATSLGVADLLERALQDADD